MKKIFFCLGVISLISTLSATELYKPCAGCHGEKGQKTALDRSKVIAKMSKQEITDALNGYREKNYGGAMKGLMKVQVQRLTPEEIVELAEFISKK